MGRKSNLLVTKRTNSQHEYLDLMVAAAITLEVGLWVEGGIV